MKIVSSNLKHQIPLTTLPNWIKAAAACGFSIESVFRELDIEMDWGRPEDATLSSSDLERLMLACVRRARGRHFPLYLGQTFGFEYMPEVESFIATSSTLRESTRVLEWLQVLINPMLKMRVIEGNRFASLRLEWDSAVPGQAIHWFAEATFTSVLKFGRTLLNERGDFAELALSQPEPPYAQQVRAFLRLPVKFSQAFNSLEIDARLLDVGLGGASDTLHRFAEARVSERLSDRIRPVRAEERVSALFEREPELLAGDIRQVSDRLHVHPRTLQRRLASEQTSLADIRSRARMSLAAKWLAEGEMAIELISDRLGFADRRSFSRAFGRWAGKSPSAFRKEKLGLGSF